MHARLMRRPRAAFRAIELRACRPVERALRGRAAVRLGQRAEQLARRVARAEAREPARLLDARPDVPRKRGVAPLLERGGRAPLLEHGFRAAGRRDVLLLGDALTDAGERVLASGRGLLRHCSHGLEQLQRQPDELLEYTHIRIFRSSQ